MKAFDDAYRGRRVLVTGHTGFKGSWLVQWLLQLGAEVAGYSLDIPSQPSNFELLGLDQRIRHYIGDIRDPQKLAAAIDEFKPDVVFHLAAQALVRRSYADPVGTFETNTMGMVQLLECVRQREWISAAILITSDKAYRNDEWCWGYREIDALGGHDPYSSSKSCADLIAQSYVYSFMREGKTRVAITRAGNVIGGGDWATDRLVPDILRAFEKSQPVIIRNPHATRPWQHVLEPLSGYLMLAERLYADGQIFAEGWNFGPNDADAQPVKWIVSALASAWGDAAKWQVAAGEHPHEAHHLKLDISKAKARLAWQPRWNLPTALNHITTWHQAWLNKQPVRELCHTQIQQYISTQA